MPSFYSHPMPRHPLTPPEHYGPYSNTSGTYYPSSGQYGFTGSESHYNLDGHDKYGMSHQDPFARDILSEPHRPMATGFSTALGRRDNGYSNLGAPVLPPIRIPDNTMDNHIGRRQSALATNAPIQAPRKEEKVAGGVAAHLDYEMEQMIDFVAEMAQGIIQPNASVSPAFRKYVSQILTSTRLPCSTILLALHYLATRMTMLSVRGVYTSSDGHLYHMFTTSLMLASKFLDDNTFQNRSWAEVSHIPVADLNKHEMEWLVDCKWKLHIDATDPQGFSVWLGQWERWQTKKVVMSMEALKLTAVDVRLPQSAHKYAPPTPVYTPSYSEPMFNMPPKDHSPPHWSQWPSQRTISPASTNHSGSTTPDWFGKAPPPWFGQLPLYSARQLPSHLTMMQSNQSPYYGSYSQQQYPPTWCGHGIGFSCSYYPMHNDRHAVTHGYGVQPVAG